MRQTETSDRPSGGIKADLILLGHFCVHVHAQLLVNDGDGDVV